MAQIRQVAVVGAGVMGAGIAAQLASAGVAVTLLDLDADRAQSGVARQLKSGGFSDAADAQRIRTGATGSDMALLADADWIIESVAERLDVKQGLYLALQGVRKLGSVVSSNTSTLPLAKLTSGLDTALARDVLITHFFNPPRIMRLLEIVAGPATRPDACLLVADFAEVNLGKSVVFARDTPGFIANRIGNFWMAAALSAALAERLTVEEADAVSGAPFGLPVGIFTFADLVGLDLMAPVLRSLQAALPADDALQAFPDQPPVLAHLVARGATGRKAGAGFVRRRSDGSFEVLDLETLIYRPRGTPEVPALSAASGDLRALMSHDSAAGRFALDVMTRTLAYAARHAAEIADTPQEVDRAMRDGYGWRQGPFELIARIGCPWLTRKAADLGIPASPKLSVTL